MPRSIRHAMLCFALAIAFLAACNPEAPLAPPPAAQVATPTPVPPTTAPPTLAPTRTPTAVPTAMPTATAVPTVTPVPATPLAPTPTLAALDLATREQVFDQLWDTVNRRYLYRDFRGVDWQAVRAQYAPRVRDAATPEQFYAILGAMIDMLGDQHSRFESPQDVAQEQAQVEGTLRYGGIGVWTRDDPTGVLIFRVGVGGPAELAGLRPRDLILAINSVPVTDTAAFGPAGPEGAVRGDPGTSVRISVRSPGGHARDMTLVRQIIPEDAFPPVTTQRLPNTQVGILAIHTFAHDQLIEQLRAEIQSLLAGGPLTGLIVDVRDNGGGYIHLMLETLGLFVDGGTIGTSGGRRGSEDLVIPSGQVVPQLANVPIVVLTSGETASAAEMFSAGMRVRHRARFVGTTTAGNTENLLLHDFSDGSRLWLAEQAYRLPDNSELEGVGVAPDRVVDAEWWHFATADDPQVHAALEELGRAPQ